MSVLICIRLIKIFLIFIFNATSSIDKAEKELDELIHEFTIANIPEYEKFVGLLLNLKKEIVNAFTIYRGKRINNGVAESLNSIVSALLFNTKGIRNHERRKKESCMLLIKQVSRFVN